MTERGEVLLGVLAGSGGHSGGRSLGPDHGAQARLAYRRALEALHGWLPRIPRPELRESLLRSESVARPIEETGRVGVPAPPV